MADEHVLRILEVANEAYPDDGIYQAQLGNDGDGLATFICNEISETAEGTTQKQAYEAAIHALENAAYELNIVIMALRDEVIKKR